MSRCRRMYRQVNGALHVAAVPEVGSTPRAVPSYAPVAFPNKQRPEAVSISTRPSFPHPQPPHTTNIPTPSAPPTPITPETHFYLGGTANPNDFAIACMLRRCTLKISLSWWLLYARMYERYASLALWCR